MSRERLVFIRQGQPGLILVVACLCLTGCAPVAKKRGPDSMPMKNKHMVDDGGTDAEMKALIKDCLHLGEFTLSEGMTKITMNLYVADSDLQVDARRKQGHAEPRITPSVFTIYAVYQDAARGQRHLELYSRGGVHFERISQATNDSLRIHLANNSFSRIIPDAGALQDERPAKNTEKCVTLLTLSLRMGVPVLH
jgi:hypothetical protein